MLIVFLPVLIGTDGDIEGRNDVYPAKEKVDQKPQSRVANGLSMSKVKIPHFCERNQHGRDIGNHRDRNEDTKGILANVLQRRKVPPRFSTVQRAFFLEATSGKIGNVVARLSTALAEAWA